MEEGQVHLAINGPVATLTIDNPSRLNAMDRDMYAMVPALVASAISDNAVRILVVRGAGTESFSSGSNVAEFREHRVGEAHHAYDQVENDAAAALGDCPVPVVAAVQGTCIGGGLGLALCADLRYAADNSSFSIPPGRLGVGYPMDAIARLSAVVGHAKATELLLTGQRIDAFEAMRIGLVHEVAASERFEGLVGDRCATVASMAPLTLRAARAALAGRADAADLTAACFHSQDLLEGLAAFEASRKPEFRGR